MRSGARTFAPLAWVSEPRRASVRLSALIRAIAPRWKRHHACKIALPARHADLMLVLGVETSCDDTAAAVLRDGREILANLVSSQDHVHGPYGGVVPELASRQHIENIVPIVDAA